MITSGFRQATDDVLNVRCPKDHTDERVQK